MPRVSEYADNEPAERKLLANLPFVGAKQAAYVRDTRNPIATVRSELRRVYADKMASYDESVLEARVAARTAAGASTVTDEDLRIASQVLGRELRSPEAAELDKAFGLSGSAEHRSHYDARTATQSFGSAAPRVETHDATELDRAFQLDERPSVSFDPRSNVQTFNAPRCS